MPRLVPEGKQTHKRRLPKTLRQTLQTRISQTLRSNPSTLLISPIQQTRHLTQQRLINLPQQFPSPQMTSGQLVRSATLKHPSILANEPKSDGNRLCGVQSNP